MFLSNDWSREAGEYYMYIQQMHQCQYVQLDKLHALLLLYLWNLPNAM